MTFLVELLIGELRAPGDRVAAATPEWTLVVAVGLLAWGYWERLLSLGWTR